MGDRRCDPAETRPRTHHDCLWFTGEGRAKRFSDLDLAIISEQPLSSDQSANLREDFSESDLPFAVDIVDWAVTSPAFRDIIRRTGVVVLGDTPSDD